MSLMLGCAGCTNNGNIGFLYGLWLLDSFTIDGEEADITPDHYSWRFQADVILIGEYDVETQNYVECYGTWQYVDDGDGIALNFTHTIDNLSANDRALNPPSELGIPSRAITTLTFLQRTRSSMTLSYTNSSSQTLIYTFRKSY